MNKKILVLGATGKLGIVLTKTLLGKNYVVVALVRNPDKLKVADTLLKVVKGDVTNSDDLKKVLKDVSVVVSVLGHGFRTKYPIQEKAMSTLLPLMEKMKVDRLITITGAGLRLNGDINSFSSNLSEKLITFIDPYRMKDAIDQQKLIEKSTLFWTTIRTPIHNNSLRKSKLKIGYSKPQLWNTIPRKVICDFIVECLEKDLWIRKSPVIMC